MIVCAYAIFERMYEKIVDNSLGKGTGILETMGLRYMGGETDFILKPRI